MAAICLIVPELVAGFGYKFRRFWVDERSQHWIRHVLNGKMLQDDRFEKTFRMSRDSFELLHGLLGTYLRHHPALSTHISLEPYITKQDTRYRLAIPSRTRVIAYLLFVTQGLTYTNISMQLGIGITTACTCIHECTYAICQHMYPTYIRLPTAIEAA